LIEADFDIKIRRRIQLKKIAIFLAIVIGITITGCGNNTNTNSEKKEVENQKNTEVVAVKKDEGENENLRKTQNTLSWNLEDEQVRIHIPYEIPKYSPQKQSYKFDLDSVENKIEGFTENQKEMLEKNGFVVIKGEHPYYKMNYPYEWFDYLKDPYFITSDELLYMYHIFYSETMKYMELTDWGDKLEQLVGSVSDKSLRAYERAETDIKEDLKYVCAYINVADRLMGKERTLPKDIEAMVAKEIENIENAQGVKKSDIFGIDVDYTQYTVRGHYTRAEELKKYFKTMMWLGQSGFQMTTINSDKETFKLDESVRSLMFTTILLSENKDDYQNYLKLYNMTSLFSGQSDDIGVVQLVKLIKDVYGTAPDLEVFRDDKYESKLKEAVLNLEKPKIETKIASEFSEVNIPKGRQFRLMGQRYTLDSDIISQLTVPGSRPLPSSLDVLSAFGHKRAEKINREYNVTDQIWSGYNEKLKLLQEKIASRSVEDWQKDLYTGWLWSIDAAAQSFEDDENMPPFMQTEAWSDKAIASALGSYAELKHDNVLYSKQPVAECGGGVDYKEYHYVEPNVELYTRLLWLSKYTKANLENCTELDEGVTNILNSMIDMIGLMQSASIKELEGKEITQKEYATMGGIGGLIDYISEDYKFKIADATNTPNGIDEKTSAIISDIATILPNEFSEGGYLELGTGLPHQIYVICPIDGRLYLTRGAVYSPYEFVSDERLTDEKWHNMIGLRKPDDNYGDYTYGEPEIELLDVMPWMKSYVSDENSNIDIEEPEIEWEPYEE
jgi:hypothetical protein